MILCQRSVERESCTSEINVAQFVLQNSFPSEIRGMLDNAFSRIMNVTREMSVVFVSILIRFKIRERKKIEDSCNT